MKRLISKWGARCYKNVGVVCPRGGDKLVLVENFELQIIMFRFVVWIKGGRRIR